MFTAKDILDSPKYGTAYRDALFYDYDRPGDHFNLAAMPKTPHVNQQGRKKHLGVVFRGEDIVSDVIVIAFDNNFQVHVARHFKKTSPLFGLRRTQFERKFFSNARGNIRI